MAKTCTWGRRDRGCRGGAGGHARRVAPPAAASLPGAVSTPHPAPRAHAGGRWSAQMLRDPGCAPKPQHVLTLAPPNECEVSEHSGSGSGRVGVGDKLRRKRRRSTLSLRDDPTRRRREASSERRFIGTPDAVDTVVGTVGTPLGTPKAPPTPPRGRPRAARQRFVVRGVVPAVAAAFPESSSPRRRARELELANARGRLVLGCPEPADDDGEEDAIRLNPATRAAAGGGGRELCAATTALNMRATPERTGGRSPGSARRHPLGTPPRHPLGT